MKRIININNVHGTTTKYVLREEYEGFGIYQHKTPTGYFVHQDWLISNGNIELVVESYNNICKEELPDMIDNYNEKGKFNIKAVMHCDSLHMHNSGISI